MSIINFDMPRVRGWLAQVFPGADHDVEERALRLGEEALELIQALGVSQHQAEALVAQVFAKEPGEPFQELGGVTVTLASLCAVANLDADSAYATEFSRCEQPETIAKIQRKHREKLVVSSTARAANPAAPEFIVTSEQHIASRNRTAYYGKNPFDDLVRAEARGRQVTINGEVKTIAAVEAFCLVAEPRKGVEIGLLLEQ